jgi:DNA-binding winged helix-turn-helix (wHTH) protein
MRHFADDLPMTASTEPRRPIGRIRLAQEADFQLAQLLVRPSLREVVGGGRCDILEPRIMQVLVTLAALRGRVVARDELIESCWDGRVVGEDAINRTISRLRRLADRCDGAFKIDTVARVGYRLTEGIPQSAARSPAEPHRWSWRRAPDAMAAVAVRAARALGLARD